MEEILELLIPIVAIVFGSLIVLIPIAGLTARFAFKPMMDVFMKYRESQGQSQSLQLLERRVALIEEQQHKLDRALSQVLAETDFQKQLHSPPDRL